MVDAGEDAPIVSKYKKMFKDNASIAVANPAESFQSATLAEKGSEITKIIQDARIKFIMGTLDEAGWNQAVEQWKKSGGDKVIEEYTAQYVKLKK
ncbi:Lipoprotein LipO precursor [compost metagenome]